MFFLSLKSRNYFIKDNDIISILMSRKGDIPTSIKAEAFSIVDKMRKNVILEKINEKHIKKIVFKKKTKGSRPILSSSKESFVTYLVKFL